MRTRRAASLAELVVVMTACATLITTSAALMHRAMFAQSKARSYLAAQNNALRLSDQLRRDVHQANSSVSKDLPANVVLRLQIGETQTVEYRHEGGVVQRTLSAGERVVSREAFTFPPDIDLAVREAEAPRRVILSIAREPGNPKSESLETFATPVNLHVEACLGRGTRNDVAVPQPEVNP